MGMSTHVYGFKPVDKKYKKLEEIYHLCNEQGITIPDEVDDFFNGERPDPCGVIIDLKDKSYVSKYCDDMSQGFEIDLTKISRDINIIRFVNSY